jgi:hypothetical protein
VGDGSNVRDLVKGALAGEVFSFLEKAGSIAHSMNTRVYVVGGFVRDLFLRTPNQVPDTTLHRNQLPSTLSPQTSAQDIDLVVEGDGLTFADKLAKVDCTSMSPMMERVLCARHSFAYTISGIRRPEGR